MQAAVRAVRAIACLPALVGSWRDPGGGLLQLPLWSFPINWGTLMRPDLIGKDVRVLNQWKLGQALTGEMGLDPVIKSLFVYNSNPVAVVPEQEKVVRGLGREDLFTVVSEHSSPILPVLRISFCRQPPRPNRRT